MHHPGGRGRTKEGEFDLAQFCADYQPKNEPRWPEVRGFVTECLRAEGPDDYPTVHRTTRALTWLGLYCLDQGFPLSHESAFHPDVIDALIATLKQSGRPARSLSSYRGDLRRIGKKLTLTAPYRPKPDLPFPAPVRPYTDHELRALRQVLETQSTPARRQSGTALFLLGIGAGLDGRWAARVTAQDLHWSSTGTLLLAVGSPQARQVPVDPQYADDLYQLASSTGTECLVGRSSTSPNRASALISQIVIPSGVPALRLRSLRDRWIANQLMQGIALPHVLEAAGLKNPGALDDLLPFLRDACGAAPWIADRLG